MSTLEEEIDINVPIEAAWDCLHQIAAYPRFVEGVRAARTAGAARTRLDIEAGGRIQELEAEITDRAKENRMEWRTTDGPRLTGAFSLLPVDREHTRVQVRITYDPDAVKEAFGGPKGFAQVTAIERLVRGDLEHFKELVEQQPSPSA